MPSADIVKIAEWWGALMVLTVAGIPLARILFAKWDSRGYIFAKILGLAGTGLVVWILGTLNILPFSRINILVGAGLFLGLGLFLGNRVRRVQSEGKWWRVAVAEELIFAGLLIGWVWVRGHAPDVRDLEKFMDFGFAKSIFRSEYFPPADMWFAGEKINYYYFGHLLMALVAKLSGVGMGEGFNLMLASLFAWCFTGAASIGRKLLAGLGRGKAILGSILVAYLVTFGGNLHTIYIFTKGYKYDEENPPPFWKLLINPLDSEARKAGWEAYWYPNATRFIPYTIHEFPSYSFVVSDIHGHVLDIPLALTAIALLIVIFGENNRTSRFTNGVYGITAGAMFTTNALDGPIYLGLLGWLHLGWTGISEGWKKVIHKLPWKVLVIAAVLFGVTTLPFMHHFQSFVSGVGVNCAPGVVYNQLRKLKGVNETNTEEAQIVKIGPLIFEGPEKCQKSPVWMMLLLWGFFLVGGIYSQTLDKNDWRKKFFGLMGLYCLGLILFAEFFYFKDIYPQHFRSNTMFKLGYQAFMMMSIVCGVMITEAVVNLRKRWKFVLLAIPLVYLVAIYPFLSVKSYFGNLSTTPYRGLGGFEWFKTQYPDDYAAAIWLEEKVIWPEQPTILEAAGDSYTDYERVSSFTGLPTVAGWAVHEWLWRGEYGPIANRAAEVQRVYEMSSIEDAKSVVEKYKVKYVVVGEMERKKYSLLDVEKISQLGKEVFRQGETVVIEIE